jgi:ribonuclease VapC
MAGHSKAVILDSWAVLAYFQNEPAAEPVQKILLVSQDNGTRLVMTVINAGEVWYNYARRASTEVANERIQQLRMTGIEFIEADWDLTKEAARFKSRYPIAYADCFAAALAKREGGRLVTGDPEFRRLDKEISVTWI